MTKIGKETNALIGVSISPIIILNQYKSKQGEYIGRGSPLGNPFVIGKHGDRKEVIEAYRIYLRKKIDEGDPVIIDELQRLGNKAITDKGLALRCFCAPKPCHGDIIKDVIIDALYKWYLENPNG